MKDGRAVKIEGEKIWFTSALQRVFSTVFWAYDLTKQSNSCYLVWIKNLGHCSIWQLTRHRHAALSSRICVHVCRRFRCFMGLQSETHCSMVLTHLSLVQTVLTPENPSSPLSLHYLLTYIPYLKVGSELLVCVCPALQMTEHTKLPRGLRKRF